MTGNMRCQAFLCGHPLQWHEWWQVRTQDGEPTYCAGDDCGTHRIVTRSNNA